MGRLYHFIARTPAKGDPLDCQRPGCGTPARGLRLHAEKDEGNYYDVRCAVGHVCRVLVPDDDIVALATWTTYDEENVLPWENGTSENRRS